MTDNEERIKNQQAILADLKTQYELKQQGYHHCFLEHDALVKEAEATQRKLEKIKHKMEDWIGTGWSRTNPKNKLTQQIIKAEHLLMLMHHPLVEWIRCPNAGLYYVKKVTLKTIFVESPNGGTKLYDRTTGATKHAFDGVLNAERAEKDWEKYYKKNK